MGCEQKSCIQSLCWCDFMKQSHLPASRLLWERKISLYYNFTSLLQFRYRVCVCVCVYQVQETADPTQERGKWKMESQEWPWRESLKRELSPDEEDAQCRLKQSDPPHWGGSTAVFIFSLKTEHLNEPEADPYLYLACLVLLTFLFSMPHTWLF